MQMSVPCSKSVSPNSTWRLSDPLPPAAALPLTEPVQVRRQKGRFFSSESDPVRMKTNGGSRGKNVLPDAGFHPARIASFSKL
jgi:hypothetical protein